jgi:hypothetical protein
MKKAIANQRDVWEILLRMQQLSAEYMLRNLPNPPRRSLARANQRRRCPRDFRDRRCAPRSDLHLKSLIHLGHFSITAPRASLRSVSSPL